jgi:osmotically-inducible protein OsmY
MVMKSDLHVQQDVSDELRWEPSINASDIGVVVKDGVVTLTGRVGSYAEKWHAERAAQRVHGVRALTLDIEIVLPGSSQRSDVYIALAIAHAFRWSVYVPADAIQVAVEHGCVTLSGEVGWDYQRGAAAELVRHMLGVTAVSNQVTLRREISSTRVKSAIDAALKRRVRDEADSIQVAVDNGDVTLNGSVPSWSEKDAVRHAAWGTTGVHTVVDNLKVAG